MGEKKCLMHLWDTAGQERFQTLIESFYRNTQFCVLLYDTTNKKTFDHVESWNTEFRVKSFQCINDDEAYVLLVGTKSGIHLTIFLHNTDICQEDDTLREVSIEDARKLQQKIGAVLFAETSSKNNENVQEIIQFIIKNSINKGKYLGLLTDRIEMQNLHDINDVDLSNSFLYSFPEKILMLESLKQLNLESNNISIIPKEIENLIHLEELNLSKNKIKNIPIEISKLKNLKIIDLSENEDLEKKYNKKFNSFFELLSNFCDEFKNEEFINQEKIGEGIEGFVVKTVKENTKEEFALKFIEIKNKNHELAQFQDVRIFCFQLSLFLVSFNIESIRSSEYY